MSASTLTFKNDSTPNFNYNKRLELRFRSLFVNFVKIAILISISEFVDRRPGDVAWLWCSPTKAKEELGWVATRNITDMCRDMWKFQSLNPSGYTTDLTEPDSKKKELDLENTSDEETSDSRSDSGLSSNLDQSEHEVSDQSESIESSPSSSPITPRRPTLFSRFVHLSDPRDQFGLKSASTSLPDKTREL